MAVNSRFVIHRNIICYLEQQIKLLTVERDALHFSNTLQIDEYNYFIGQISTLCKDQRFLADSYGYRSLSNSFIE